MGRNMKLQRIATKQKPTMRLGVTCGLVRVGSVVGALKPKMTIARAHRPALLGHGWERNGRQTGRVT